MFKQQGFSLLELVVTVAILAIVSVTLVPLLTSMVEKSRICRLLATTSSLENAAMAYHSDIGSFPSETQTAFSESLLVVDEGQDSNWDGPYLSQNNRKGISPWGAQMLLSQEQMNGVGEENLEYVLLVPSQQGAAISQDSYTFLDEKIDGISSQFTTEGKIQREGLSSDETVKIAIVADAFANDNEEENESPQLAVARTNNISLD